MLIKNKILHVLFLALIFSLSAVAQNAKTENNTQDYRQGGWWTFGINGGSSYQTSDVCSTYDGWGVGLTLAKNLYYRPNAPLAFDLRGRLLYANQKGQDWERSLGLQGNEALNGLGQRDFVLDELNYLNNPALNSDSFYIANHRTDLLELGLEGVINLNRLKERTNVIVNLYGGLNVDWYKARIDQANGGLLTGTEYDYSNISTTDKATALTSLETLRDYSYETLGDGHKNEYGTFTWMPSAGVELGYQLTPRFSIIGGHKVTWSLDDIMDGQRWNNDNTASTNNDLYHYTHLGLRWIIDPHEKTMDPPIIKIIRPRPLPHSTQTAYVSVKAEIENVYSAADVNCTFNGSSYSNFSFNPKSEDFNTNLNLVPGRNELVITATNMAGQDTENVIIIYNEPTTIPTPDKTPPVVKITRPSRPGTKVSSPSYNLHANVNHVDSRSNIKVYLNGQSITNFSYSFNSDKLESALNLQTGRNVIKVTGTNKDGSDSDETTIIYEKEETICPDPVVSISNISTPKATSNPNIASSSVTAIIKNVANRSDIRMYVNGDRTTDFSYNTSNGKLTATINVGRGRNEVAIVATTNCGKDEDKENVTYNMTNTNPTPTPTPTPTPIPTPNPPTQQPPIVDISTPNNGISTNNSTVNLVATVKHVTSRNQIRMTLNGISYNNFSYNTSSKVLKANNVPIRIGTNTLEVKATNNAGTDSDDVLVIRNSNTPTNPGCTEPIAKIDNITMPAATMMNPNIGKSILYASTKHITSKNQIKLYINGSKTTNFSFNASTGKITANLNLNAGNTSIKLVVTNNCGTDQDTDNVTFQANTTPACPKPTANIDNITMPAATMMNPNIGKSILYASTQNVSNKNEVKLYINGSKTTNFSFNASTGKVTANLNLNAGNTSIKLVVTNNCGTDQDTDNVTFQVQQPSTPKPVVNIVKPTNNATFNTSKTNLSVTVFNVTKKNDITVKINGTKTTNFSFNASAKNVSATINLQEGNNNIFVSATNAGGTDSDTKKVKYVKPVPQSNPPVVKIIKPSNGATVKSNKVDLKATVLNVTSKSNVTVKVNNVAVSNFNFSGNTVTAQLPMKTGNNTIQVIGKNQDGQDQKSVTVKYVKPVNPPTVKITAPSKDITVNNSNYDLKATLTNIKAKKDVTIKLNGSKITTFVYNVRAGKLSAPLTLKPGKNTIEVTGVNSAGSATDSKVIHYRNQTPITNKQPTVKIDNITTPAATMMNPNIGKSIVYATTQRITSKGDIKMKINGQVFSGFTFNASTGKIVANINLKKGSNTVEIEVTNKSGKDTDSSTVPF